MNLTEHTLRVAALSAVADYFAAQAKAARIEAQDAYRAEGVKKVAIRMPDGEEVGEVTVNQPSPSVKIDEDDLLAWCERHTPTEVEEYLDSAALTDQEAIEWARAHRDDLLCRRIRQVWRAELQKVLTGNDGYVIDVATGEATKVAEVTVNRPTGAFSLSADRTKTRADRLIAALRAGELNAVVGGTGLLALPAGGGQ